MGNSIHIFNIVCSEDIVGDDSKYKRIKLENQDDKEKIIKLCGPHIGAYSIIQKEDGQEFFGLWTEDARYSFREGDFCNSWTDGKLHYKREIPLERVKLKVILDGDCEYKIAVSVEDNQWITLPKSSLFGENLNLKKYYNKELQLLKGEKCYQSNRGDHYISKVMYGLTEICELSPVSFPGCDSSNGKMWGSSGFSYTVKDHKIVVKKNDAGELSIYLEKKEGTRVDQISDGTKNVVDYANSVLKAVLLENSNIREVLPELEIDDNVNLDTRQLSCWIDKTSTIQKIATDESFKSSVKDLLKSDPEFINSVKGERGLQGPEGPRGQAGEAGESPSAGAVATQLLTDSNNKNTLVTEVAKNEDLQRSVAGSQDLRTAVATNLKKDETFQTTVKGEPGLQGKEGPQGLKGEDANPEEVVQKWANDSGKRYLISREIVSNENFQRAVKYLLKQDSKFKSDVEDLLKSDQDFKDSVKGDPGQDGESPSINAVAAKLMSDDNRNTLVTEVASNEDLQEAIAGSQVLRATIDSLTKANNAQQNFTLQKGERLLDDVYEANIVSNNKTMATLPKIGYYMLNNQLVVHNHVTKEKVVIPEDFHFLKVIKFGSGFSGGDYKLTFCNVLGNEFFEYKKYDPQYSNVPDEYKFISLNCAKKEYNPNLSELFSHRPSFFITEGPAEPNSDKYSAAVFELTRNGKGKKMATLIDKFGYFDQDGVFMHCNYHEETKCRSYTSAEIDKEYQVTDADSEFYLTGHDNVIIHTIPELI